jgi:hypothetical protein
LFRSYSLDGLQWGAERQGVCDMKVTICGFPFFVPSNLA